MVAGWTHPRDQGREETQKEEGEREGITSHHTTPHHTRTKHTHCIKQEGRDPRIKKAIKEKHSWVGRGDVDGVPSFDTLPHPSIHQGRQRDREVDERSVPPLHYLPPLKMTAWKQASK